jgi:hypothetical protein|tara:strand:- start:167 stop:358 length:192 start_codon:yes stop_codon:yes gene_type:complete
MAKCSCDANWFAAALHERVTKNCTAYVAGTPTGPLNACNEGSTIIPLPERRDTRVAKVNVNIK